MKLVDEAVVVEFIEIEANTSKLTLPDEVKQQIRYKPGLKIGIIRDLQTSTIDNWKTSLLIKKYDIILFNTSLPTTPKVFETKTTLDGKKKHIEIIYTQEIAAILEEGDIEEYNLDLVQEYNKAKELVAEYKTKK